jgi:tRNA pseudouridine13 synthase
MRLAFASKTSGIGGSLKNSPEDFLVEEITNDGTILELDAGNRQLETENSSDKSSKFTHFVLQKRDWSTPYAIKEIAKRLHTSAKRFSYAGLKDKSAITTQLISAEALSAHKIQSLKINDIRINGAWSAADKVRLGQLAGNRFTIKVRGACPDAQEKVQQIHKELDGQFPNYFGEQRFGSISRNTHIIGEKIIRGDFKEAVMTFLTDYEKENNPESKSARKELRDSQDFKTALQSFPKHLRFERTIISHLSTNPDDFIGALKQLPRQTLLLFVHAYQSYLFNQLLSDRICETDGKIQMEEGEYFCNTNKFGYPDLQSMDVEGFLCMKILGYNSNPNDREKKMLKELNIRKEDFRIKELPEISSKGTFRVAFAPLRDFSFKDETFRFSLQSGSYATAALREFLEVKNLSSR